MVHGILTIPLAGQTPRAGCEPPAHAAARATEFIAGPENSIAAWAMEPMLDPGACGERLLVLYGPHGSGKSHLARGLADWWTVRYPAAKVVCQTAAEFAEAAAAAHCGQEQLSAWRDSVRGAALLVLEDIAQLAGKRLAQLELLHTLDALAERQTPVIVTARTLPTHSSVLMAPLKSRLSAALLVHISLPGPAARRAILTRLAEALDIAVPAPVLSGLAKSLNGSASALGAALLELDLSAKSDGHAIDVGQLRELVVRRTSDSLPRLRDIAAATAKYFGYSVADLKGPGRRQPLAVARGLAMYLAR